jgi:hypothetical protein
MAITFQITNEDETSTYNFLNDTVRLVQSTYEQVALPQEQFVFESFQTITTGTSESAIHTDIGEIERLLDKAAKWFEDKTKSESIWLKVASESETARRSLIRSWTRMDHGIVEGTDALLYTNLHMTSTWTIERYFVWEALAATESSLGGLTTFDQNGLTLHRESAVAKGSAPMRITHVDADPGTGDSLDKIWIGIKPMDVGASFPTYINCGGHARYVQLEANVTEAFSDGTAVGGTTVKAFYTGTTDFTNRFQTGLVTNYDDELAGQWVILLRARNDNSDTTSRVGLFVTWGTNDSTTTPADTLNDVWVTGDTWHMYDMGVVQFPPEGYRQIRRDNQPSLNYLSLGCAAGRSEGTGDLLCDLFAWIPYDHFFSAKNIGGGASDAMEIVTTEDDETMAYMYDFNASPQAIVLTPEISTNNWRMPERVATSWFCAGEETSASGLLKEIDLTPEVLARYFSYNTD